MIDARVRRFELPFYSVVSNRNISTIELYYFRKFVLNHIVFVLHRFQVLNISRCLAKALER